MNLKRLLTRVLAQLNEDVLEDDRRALAVAYVNEAYDEMMRMYRPHIDVTLLVPEDGVVPLSLLGARTGRVLSVRKGIGEVPFDVDELGIRLTGGEGAVIARCRYNPAPLVEDGDVPELPESFHGALADYATYRMMGTGGRARQQRADMFFSRYLTRKSQIAPEGQRWRDRIVRKFG
jgi:hypothetical protein